MSRVEEVEKSRKEMRKYFERLNEHETITDVRHYLAPLVTQIADISMSLAVIADKLSEEKEEIEDACVTCKYEDYPPDEWPCSLCNADANLYRPRATGQKLKGQGGPESGDH